MQLYTEQILVFKILKISICLYIGAAPISEIIGYDIMFALKSVLLVYADTERVRGHMQGALFSNFETFFKIASVQEKIAN